MSALVHVEAGSPWSVEVLSTTFGDLAPRVQFQLFFGQKLVSNFAQLATDAITGEWDSALGSLTAVLRTELENRGIVVPPDLMARIAEAAGEALKHSILAVIRNQAATLIGFVSPGDACRIWDEEGARYVMEL